MTCSFIDFPVDESNLFYNMGYFTPLTNVMISLVEKNVVYQIKYI